MWSRYVFRFAQDTRPPEVIGNLYLAWMYILECIDGSYYLGSTNDLEGRLLQHQQGLGAKYTSRRLPVKLVYSEEYERVSDAYAREKQVQNWSRVKRVALINENQEMLPKLAKKAFNKRKPLVEEPVFVGRIETNNNKQT